MPADPTPPPPHSRIAAELAAAGFVDAAEVGHGGAGVVFRCHQTSLRRSVAIKVLASDLSTDNQERFLREGYAMGGLSGHPNIMNILQVGVTESRRPYIVMPYYPAGSLAERLRRSGRIAWPDALRIGVKLAGALETAHRAGTLHRDIKPGNVLVNEYGEPQLSDFGIARIAGGYETATGFFTGTIAYTAPEVLAGAPPTVESDVYSLGATIYALIAGTAAHERKSGEEVVAHYLRISSTPIPDLRTLGIPHDVCTAIEKAMSLDPAERQGSAADFGHDLQAVQRRNGLLPDSMAINDVAPGPGEADGTAAIPASAFMYTDAPQPISEPRPAPVQRDPAPPPISPPAPVPIGEPDEPTRVTSHKSGRRALLSAILAAVVAVILIGGSVYYIATRNGAEPAGVAANPAQPTAETQAGWRPITNARVARTATATTEADGTIWIFGGIGADSRLSARHEGYDPIIDNWKGGDDLPVPVQHAMAVTWQGNPVVLGGWRADGTDTSVATDRVWRVVNSRWVELPPLLQPRAAAAAAVVGDRIIVAGGVGANGRPLATTEIFDGASWRLGADMPTPRQMVAGASDGRVVYAVGGTNGTSDLATVESYDPAADVWTTLPGLPDARSDLGAAVADGRLVAVGGMSGGRALDSVEALDLTTLTWTGLPGMSAGRHGMAVAAIDDTVYAIGGSTASGVAQATSSAESLKLAARKPQPASHWRSLPDAQTSRLMMAWTVLDGRIWVMGGLRHGEALDTVESYDPQTGEWQSEPSMPIPLHHATATTYRGQVVVIGGASADIAGASDKVFALSGGTWSELPSLAHPRAGAAAAVVGDKLVVVGGQHDKQLVPQTEVFDGESWTQAADLPTPREHLAAVSDGTYVYTVGGRFLSADRNSAAFERFDPASGEWVKLVDMPTPRGSYGAAYVDGRIVAVGGEDPTRVLDTVEMYDIAEATWTELAPLPTPRHALVVAAVGTTVYCIGGANRPAHEGAVPTIEALDFS
ncbi:MAG: protein kinase [Actinobacteria bacterium]|nr:protein kinase [Actinomycetota bacterium]